MILTYFKKTLILILGILSLVSVCRADIRLQTPVVDGSLPPDIEGIQSRGVLRLALYASLAPPFYMVDEQGQPAGIEVDFGKMVAEQLGVSLKVVPVNSFEGIQEAVVRGQADIGLGLSIIPQRALYLDFSSPYYAYHPHFLVNRLQASRQGWATPPQIIQGMKQTKTPFQVGMLEGNAAAERLVHTFPSAQIVYYQSNTESFQDVSSGKIFAATGTTPIAIQNFLQHNPQSVLRVQDVEDSEGNDLLGIALPWQDFHLREWINVYLFYIQQNGSLSQLFAKYGLKV